MNIGDLVRSIHSGEEGIVKKILPDNIVEIEIEDSFVIPFVKSELVVVSTEEAKHFKDDNSSPSSQTTPTKTQKNKAKPKSEDGIYLCISEDDKRYSLYIVNNTSYPIVYSSYHKDSMLECNRVNSKSTSLISVKEYSFLQNSPTIHTNFTKCPSKGKPLSFEIKTLLSAKKIFKDKQELPILGGKGMLFQLDQTIKNIVDKKQLTQTLNTTSEKDEIVINSTEITNTIDLHANKLNIEDRADFEILEFQLQTFERALDNAIIFGLSEITFIHGVGNGVLRKEIHKRLSARADSFEFYKDTHKEIFGYGATYVKL